MEEPWRAHWPIRRCINAGTNLLLGPITRSHSAPVTLLLRLGSTFEDIASVGFRKPTGEWRRPGGEADLPSLANHSERRRLTLAPNVAQLFAPSKIRANRLARSLRGLIIQSGWDGADRRSSSGSPSPLRSPAACPGWHANIQTRQPAFNGHRSSRASAAGAPFSPRRQRILDHTIAFVSRAVLMPSMSV